MRHRADKRLAAILKRVSASGVRPQSLARLSIVRTLCSGGPGAGRNLGACSGPVQLLATAAAVVAFSLFLIAPDISSPECLVKMPRDVLKIFRKPENCDMCVTVNQVNRVQNISPSEFEELYAHTGKPVVVVDGTKGWSAIKTFNFEFFKSVVEHSDTKYETEVDNCQFFPYKTEFNSLAEVFNMSAPRSRLEPGTESWYVGWNNCNDYVGRVLREHYHRPYFLPANSENIALTWIFMGGPGNGAHMHVDNVIYPSWQAQIRGKKKWRLLPPPECAYLCQELSISVEQGEIIVFDTNRWYHQTFVLEGDISITIGSEFD